MFLTGKIPLGNWFGIPVGLHWSWVLLFSLVLFLSPTFAIVYGSIFLIVLLHEFGHCLAGKHYGVEINSITLYPFGGVAAMGMPSRAQEEIVIALAGPFVNVLLAPLIYLCIPLAPDTINQIFAVNLVILCFNLLPAFPMDGGRVFRAILAIFLKDHARATVIAGRIGQAFCLGFIALGICLGNVGLAVIGLFICLAAEAEIRQASDSIMIHQIHESLTGVHTPRASSNAHVENSARMMAEIQQRLAQIDERHPDSD